MSLFKNVWFLTALAVCLILLIIFLAYTIPLYNGLIADRTKGYETTKQQVTDNTALTEVNQMQTYHGSKAYHTVVGQTAEGNQEIVFYPLAGKKKELTTFSLENMLSAKRVLDAWRGTCQNCELIDITAALENNKPLWEITYYNENDVYTFQYISMSDGSPYQTLSLNRSRY